MHKRSRAGSQKKRNVCFAKLQTLAINLTITNFNFACRFLKAEDGTEIIKCRDLPELLSWSVDEKPQETWVRYAIED